MANEFISRKELIKNFWEFTNGGKQRYLIPEEIWEMVELAPTADVVEVVHAEPVKFYCDTFTGKRITTCSYCDGKISSKDKWCKHCGAKMDGTGDKLSPTGKKVE